MNERIRQFAEQAGADPDQIITNIICGDDEFDAIGNEFNKLSQETREHIYKTIEKSQALFAELIIRECVFHCDRAAANRIDEAMTLISDKLVVAGAKGQAAKLSQFIKHHFGIE